MRWALLFDSILCIMRSDGKEVKWHKRATNKKKYDKEKTKTTATTRTFKLYVSWPDFYFIRCLWTLSLRVLGTLLANCLRLVVGNTFPFAAILLILYGLLVMIYGKDFPLKEGALFLGLF